MTLQEFQNDIRAGIPDRLPAAKPYDRQINHAPKRKEILTPEEQVLADALFKLAGELSLEALQRKKTQTKERNN